MNNTDIKMLGLKCEDSKDLYDLFSLIKEGYLEKRALICEDLIDDVLSALKYTRGDLVNDKNRLNWKDSNEK